MPSFTDATPSPYSADQLYAIVADVEKYPEFLPHCRAARMLSREEGGFNAELVIGYKAITEKYTSQVRLFPAAETRDTPEIRVNLVSGPFTHLTNHWWFEPREDGGCIIHFHVDFEFKSLLMEAMIGAIFTKASQQMIAAFSTRAKALLATSPMRP